jgi:hypothetical protein
MIGISAELPDSAQNKHDTSNFRSGEKQFCRMIKIDQSRSPIGYTI